jgi:hypothetical protein
MHWETLGLTAVRKSSKVKDIIDAYSKRIPQVNDMSDMVNYTYFLGKLVEFDLASRVDTREKALLI